MSGDAHPVVTVRDGAPTESGEDDEKKIFRPDSYDKVARDLLAEILLPL